MRWIFLLLSFLIAAFGQTAWVSGLGILAAGLGYAAFWKGMLLFSRLRDQILVSFLWFAAVQGVQISWLTSTEYMGPLILAVYLFLLIVLGMQFSLLSWGLSKILSLRKEISWLDCAALSGLWTLLEWSRLFLFTGFTWNPVGLALADTTWSLQFAAIWGVYGLSFWVIFVNLAALNAVVLRKSKKQAAGWAALALLPYVLGAAHLKWAETRMPSSPKNFSAALVQTGLLPEQKDYFLHLSQAYIPPLDQWDRVLSHIKEGKKIDLIVLPEAAFPLGAYRSHYFLETVKMIWEMRFGKEALKDFPPLESPYASFERGRWRVNNAFLAQALANHLQSDLVVGLDDQDRESGLKYNASFHFRPNGVRGMRMEKRVLVPVAEYIPLKMWKGLSGFLSQQFGIGDSFQPGTDVKIFHASIPIGVSICVEETYTGLIRELRLKGAELFVNITNDVWFPGSRLPLQHFLQARLRAVENGICSVRACNTGITGGIDCFGRPLKLLAASEDVSEILYLSFPLRSYKTLYTWWGDTAILGISCFCIFFAGGVRRWDLYTKGKKKLP